jgi:hypothetical protein
MFSLTGQLQPLLTIPGLYCLHSFYNYNKLITRKRLILKLRQILPFEGCRFHSEQNCI